MLRPLQVPLSLLPVLSQRKSKMPVTCVEAALLPGCLFGLQKDIARRVERELMPRNGMPPHATFCWRRSDWAAPCSALPCSGSLRPMSAPATRAPTGAYKSIYRRAFRKYRLRRRSTREKSHRRHRVVVRGSIHRYSEPTCCVSVVNKRVAICPTTWHKSSHDLLIAIKREVDRDRRPGRFVLTGSANLLAMKPVRESLAGRASCVSLWPLTRRERLGLGVAGVWPALTENPMSPWRDVLLARSDIPSEDWRQAARTVPRLASSSIRPRGRKPPD